MASFKLGVTTEDLKKIDDRKIVVLEDSNGRTKVMREKGWLEIVTPYVLFLLVAWAIPMTTTVIDNHYELKQGPRFTAFDGQALEHRMDVIEHRVEKLPPTNLLKDVSELKSEVKKLNSLVTRLEVIIENNNRIIHN